MTAPLAGRSAVVTGTQPGGVVVVRFARDGAEKTLVADLAPIRRR